MTGPGSSVPGIPRDDLVTAGKHDDMSCSRSTMRHLTMPGRSGIRSRYGVLCLIAVYCLALVGGAPAGNAPASPAVPHGGATFDLQCMFPEQMLSPATGKTDTFMNLEVRNTGDRKGEVSLSVHPQSAYIKAEVRPGKVTPGGEKNAAKCRVDVRANQGTPDGTVCWIKVTGNRRAEKHRIWLKVTSLTSKPKIELSRGFPFTGQGHLDPELQAYVGRPLKWNISAKNYGGGEDTYRLSSNADFPCRVEFLDPQGKRINRIKRQGLTRNLLFPKPAELKVSIKPLGELPKNEPREVRLMLGPGERTGEVSEIKVQVVNPGMLFCVNDIVGLRPHPHQVMPGETTAFVFHLTNIDSRKTDINVSTPGSTEGWTVVCEGEPVVMLKPGETSDFTLNVTAPGESKTGQSYSLEVRARSSAGRSEQVTVAAEVTDVRNVYCWSIDSMDPEYLYMNRAGTGRGKDGDWLMPNTRAFMEQGANFKNARVYLPSATDMNHTNALAGTYTGTQGIYMVGGTYRGFSEHDEVLSGPNTMDLMLFGSDGKPVERMFEVAKRNTGGKALCGFWSNKNWLAELEGERSVDIVGHSERWPLFFKPPYKYRAAGDPRTDRNPGDPLSGSFKVAFHSNNFKSIMIPTLLGQFDLYFGLRVLSIPLSIFFGKTPGMHAEDRYIAESFFRSIKEEDPDVSYINIADLDNTGHFTGASWPLDEWVKNGTGELSDDRNKYSPFVLREDGLDIAREADVLFGDFIDLLKDRGVYDNSTIVVLSDHGMENMKDPRKGYTFIDLREILRKHGYLRHEDYNESGGTEINLIWGDDSKKLDSIERVLEGYTVDDRELGRVHPLTVINRREMAKGVDFGKAGKVRPGELYSEYWINHPGGETGERWPDLFVFPLYNYQVAAHGDVMSTGINAVGINMGINVPDTVKVGLPGAHGGLQTTRIPLIFKAPAGYEGYPTGSEYPGEVEVGDIAPTIYQIMGWPSPRCVDGKPLPQP